MPKFGSEEEMAAHVVAWLRREGWEVYQEVKVNTGDRLDIVAERHGLLRVVEAKRNFGWAVLSQAMPWVGKANEVSVATPWSPHWRTQEEVCRAIGVGTIRVSSFSNEPEVRETLAPRQFAGPCDLLRRALHPDQKEFAPAGNANGKFSSPWRRTLRNVSEAVKRSPGMTFRQIAEAVNHHYADTESAVQCIRRAVQVGYVSDVRIDEATRPWTAWPKPKP